MKELFDYDLQNENVPASRDYFLEKVFVAFFSAVFRPVCTQILIVMYSSRFLSEKPLMGREGY